LQGDTFRARTRALAFIHLGIIKRSGDAPGEAVGFLLQHRPVKGHMQEWRDGSESHASKAKVLHLVLLVELPALRPLALVVTILKQ